MRSSRYLADDGRTVRALIVDSGAGRSALAGCRALAAAGWTVAVAAPASTIAARSRWATAFHRLPPPHDVGFAAAVADIDTDIVLPAGDAEAVALSAHRHDIAAVVPYAAHDVVVRAFDKVAVTDIAAGCGLRVPGPPEPGRFPVMVKARTHAHGRREATLAATEDELRAGRARHGDDAVLQEVVHGDLLAVSFVADTDSNVIARVHQRASRLWPAHAGVSTRAETVAVDADLAGAVDRFARALGWVGLAQLQFLVPPDGEPRFIDCNGRLYGSLALAQAAGVNLPALWAAQAVGRPYEGGRKARVGCRYQWLEGDLRRAVEERRGGLVRDVADTAAYALRARHSIFDRRDPMPALDHAARLLGRAARKAVRR